MLLRTIRKTHSHLSFFLVLAFLVLGMAGCGTKKPATEIDADTFSDSSLEPKSKSYYHFTVSRMLLLDRKFPESLSQLEIAETYDDNSAYLKYNLALMYISSGRIDDALEKLEKSIEIDPNHSQSFTLLGKIYASSKDSEQREKSIKILKRAVELNPRDAESLLFLGIIETEAGNYNSAEKHFKKITELYPDNERGFFFLARLYYEKGDFDKAEELYNESLQLNPSFVMALIELALVYEKQGRYEESENIYKSIISLYPNTLDTYVRYGNFLFRVNRKEDAQEQFEKAENLDYRNPDLKLRLGLLYIENREFDKAIEEFQLILLGNPNDEKAKYYLALSYIEVGNYTEALKLLETIDSDSELYNEIQVQKAFILEKQDDLEGSLKLMEKVYQNDPNNEIVVNYLGRTYRNLDRDQDAVKLYNTYLETNTDSKTILYSLGVIYYLNEQIPESLDAMKRLIKIDPNNADALNFVGYTYAERGERLDEAEALINRALEISPNKGYILDSLGWVYYQKGQYNKALDLLNQAASLQPDDPAIMEHLGDVYEKKGNLKRALEYYERGVVLIEREPSDIDPKLQERLYKKVGDIKRRIGTQS
ncbi:MAG: tetratricopeptide repeat protein [Thermodesulfobacteriota bacterium]